ncbi:hypothetical protein [Kitasatospora sp. NPDC001095]
MWKRRELLTARAFLGRAPLDVLNSIGQQAADFADHLLTRVHGFSAEELRDPDPERFGRMLTQLPPVLAHARLHHLVQHRPELEEDWDVAVVELLRCADTPGTAVPDHRDPAGREATAPLAPESEQERNVQVKSQPAPQGLSAAAEALRHAAAALAGDLRALADLVESGGTVEPADLEDRLAVYTADRARLAEQITGTGQRWDAAATFEDLDAVIAELAAAQQQAAARHARAEELRVRYDRYTDMLQEEDDEVARAGLESARGRIAEQIVELGGVLPAPAAVSLDLPHQLMPEQAPALAEDAAPEPSAEPTPEAVEEPEPVADAVPAEEDWPDDDTAPAADPEPTPELREEPVPKSAPAQPPASESTARPVTVAEPEQEPEEEEEQEQRLAFLPWEPSAGGAGPVAELVRQSRLAEAFWYTRGSDEVALRADTLAFAEAAFACQDNDTATAVLSAFGHGAAEFRDDRSAQIAATVASLRAGLVAGWPNDLLNQAEPITGLPAPWARLLEAAASTVRHCQRVNPAGGWLVDPAPGLTREVIGDQARELLVTLPQRRTSYARATQVLTRLASDGQPLGTTLRTIVEWAQGRAGLEALDAVAEQFARRDCGERLILDADVMVRTSKQAREPIEAKAKQALLRAIASVSDLLDRARSIAASQAGAGLSGSLKGVLTRVANEPAPPGVEGALLHLLRQWLCGKAPAATPLSVGDHEGFPEDLRDHRPDVRPLLVLADLPRLGDGSPDPDADGFDEAALSPLLSRVDGDAALRAHCERGDLHLAEALAAALGEGAVPAVGDAPVRTDHARTIEAARTSWSTRLRAEHADASGLLAELRIQQAPDSAAERKFSAELAGLEQPQPDGAYRAAVEQIRALAGRLSEAVSAYAGQLRADIAELELSETDRTRFEQALDKHDLVTAAEYLALARRGEPLPDWSALDWGADLTEFSAGLGLSVTQRQGQGYSAEPWARRYAPNGELTEAVGPALEAWEALCNASTRAREWQRHLPRVLRLLGLEVDPGSLTHVDDGQRRIGLLRTTVRAKVSESRPGYVASLGSRAQGRYTVVIVPEEAVGRSVLDLLDARDSGATLILYLHPLGLAGRRKLAERARAGARQALVVDPAVLGWIAARSPRSFRALQRVTLPWTGFNPYTPFVAGLVPPEVFYGRTQEINQVVDPLGGLFLYGGRQLGKSALLRRVESTFATEHHKVVYLDLKAHGIGEAEPAERIWPNLAAQLQRVGVLEQVGTKWVPDKVLEQIENWLTADPQRRLLVLADEADAFLTADSRSANGHGGESTFPNVLRLKRLMDSTGRRFKVVFAGLHQVQRFGALSNVPLTHGGPDVLVGPLHPTEAQPLVVEPMAALGYTFERPELAWQVLAATNFQASLVQIFCDQLVSALRAKPVADRWPITVTEADVRAVTASPQVRERIAERMRITINLEDRYRVLTLVIALLSLKDAHRRGYQPDELLQEARERWREGFDNLNSSQVRIYLDEMVGLGLLVRQPGDDPTYAVRSPNVVGVLGTPDALEHELRDTEFRLPIEYNPRYSRRLLGHSPSGIQTFSPLTEDQLHTVTGQGVSAVCVTEVLRPSLVVDAVEAYAAARGITVHRTDGPGLKSRLTALAKAKAKEKDAQLVIVDLRRRSQAELTDALDRLREHTAAASPAARSAVIIVDPMGVYERTDLIGEAIRPQRWTADSLRAWPESPFETPERRRRLVEATGGWPELVEQTVHQVSRTGTSVDAALEGVRNATTRADFGAVHLQKVGLDRNLAELLTRWTELLESPEEDTPARIASIIDVPEDQVLDLVRRLTDLGVLDEGDNGIALDPVTFRALAATAGQE